MITRKVVTVSMPDLGELVELHEPTTKEIFTLERDEDDPLMAISQLALMLRVDGQKFTVDEIGEWGPSITMPLLTEMNKMLGFDMNEKGEEGNG